MTGQPPIRLRCWPAEGVEATEVPLPLARPGAKCTLRLRCLSGAAGVHVVLVTDAGPLLRAEVPANAGETVAVEVGLDEGGALQLWSAGQTALSLPADERYEPAPPILPAAGEASLDFAFVIDGTVQLTSAEERTVHARGLVALAEELVAGRPECRVATIAFGDHALAGVVAKELLPRYHLFPDEEERSLRAFDRERLASDLLVPATSGGDFVDALADALDAVAGLRWRPEARKLVVLSGDSPGHSVLHPLSRGANAAARARDVDTEVARLHRKGVEVATIYHQPPPASGLYELEFRRQLLGAAQSQYVRLASLPEYAFRSATFEPVAAAQAIAGNRKPIGRGPSLAELVEVKPEPSRRSKPDGERYQSAPDAVVLPAD